MRAGDTEKNARNTYDLMSKVQEILDFSAPEVQVVRLARLFIDEYQRRTRDGDKATAAWLRELGYEKLPERVEAGEHWKWHHGRERERESS